MSSSIPPPGIANPARRVITNPLFKDSAHFTKYAAETAHTYTEVRITVGPGGGNPLHYHNSFEESFVTEKGRLGVTVGNRELILSPGETAVVPKRTNHRFFNPSDTDELVFTGKLRPGNEPFEKGLYIVYGLAEDGLTDANGVPKSLVHVAVFTSMTDTNLAGLGFWLMKPLFAVLRYYAYWSGEEARLVKRYWG